MFTNHTIPVTKHAADRIQQRGIPMAAVDLAINFGREVPAGGGATAHRLDAKGLKKARAYCGGSLGQLEDRVRGIEVILGRNGQLITAQHITKGCRWR